MRMSSKTSVCFAVISVGLFLMSSNSVWPQDAKKVNPRLKELQQKRLVVLEQLHDTAIALYKNGRVSYEDVYQTSMQLLTARCEFAESKAECLKACDFAINEAQGLIELANAKKAAARATEVEVLKAQMYLVDAEIARETIDSKGQK